MANCLDTDVVPQILELDLKRQSAEDKAEPLRSNLRPIQGRINCLEADINTFLRAMAFDDLWAFGEQLYNDESSRYGLLLLFVRELRSERRTQEYSSFIRSKGQPEILEMTQGVMGDQLSVLPNNVQITLVKEGTFTWSELIDLGLYHLPI